MPGPGRIGRAWRCGAPKLAQHTHAKRPVAFVVLKPDAAATGAEVLAALPLTAIGKVDKPALRRLPTEQLLRVRLASGGLTGTGHRDPSQGLQILFSLTQDGERPAVQARMRPFAMDWHFEGL